MSKTKKHVKVVKAAKRTQVETSPEVQAILKATGAGKKYDVTTTKGSALRINVAGRRVAKITRPGSSDKFGLRLMLDPKTVGCEAKRYTKMGSRWAYKGTKFAVNITRAVRGAARLR